LSASDTSGSCNSLISVSNRAGNSSSTGAQDRWPPSSMRSPFPSFGPWWTAVHPTYTLRCRTFSIPMRTLRSAITGYCDPAPSRRMRSCHRGLRRRVAGGRIQPNSIKSRYSTTAVQCPLYPRKQSPFSTAAMLPWPTHHLTAGERAQSTVRFRRSERRMRDKKWRVPRVGMGPSG